ncbi:Type II secretion system protein E [Lacunisphaera limnophila]|uniref:Type II secretion system protein E n=1 Tax=Lacunisphaera limnophila TaxID=1838286 RepID=A0A1D8AZI8_9BACT|nr:GspE/PulE family protein [Lacunisphaera limnophila]AOS46291.1 Type II secretion system protein E [Lacunisphaera limnophila]
MPPNPSNREFLQLVRDHPGFTALTELESTGSNHGAGTLAHLQAIIDHKLLSKDEACRLWANSIGIAYVDVLASAITDEAVAKIPCAVAQKVTALGLYLIDGVLTVALATPADKELVRRLEQITQVTISPVFCLPCEIEDAVAIHYSTEKSLTDSLAGLEQDSFFSRPDGTGDRFEAVAESESLIRVLDELVYFALRERATDIHIEPQEFQSRIRFRVDGMMREVLTFSRKLHRAIVARLKILCSLNISETRFPQDGRFSLTIGTNQANFRFSALPTVHGEKVVVRILAGTGKKSMMTLDKMLISQPVLAPLRRLVQNPSGIIFVTGPTGSGKTTTLYSALHEINQPGINISTIEDPVEIQLAGVTQSQVNSHIDLKFSTVLRSLLRQDPDVILIGEIRDLETAKIATEAALTGHLVFATLHTNTAAQAIVRLMEIGVEPSMVAPSVIGVLAQRLAARICERCKEAYYPPREVLTKYFLDEGLAEVPFYRGRGCPHCRGTGYKGRIAFHELILITEEIRQLITEGKSAQEITRAASRVGYKPLRYDGLRKVLLGLTTIDEIEQNSSFEWAS